MAKTSPRKKTKAGKTTRKKTASKPAARSRSAKTTAKKKKAVTTKRKTKTKAKKTTTRKQKATPATMKKSPTTKKKAAAAPTGTKKKKTAGKVAAGGEPKKKTTKSATGGKKAPPKNKRARSVAEVASTAAADDKGYVFINGRRVRMISTHGITMKKPQRPVAVEAAEEVVEPVKPLKTRLSKKELNHYREILLAKRADIVGDLNAMENAALRSNGGDVSHMPIHMADIGTDTYDQDFTLGLAETERKQLREIDEALARIEDKTYGVCMMTGKDIPKARLDAKPWARYTIEAARIVESQTQG